MNRLLTTLFAVWLPLSTLALEKEAREMPKGGIDKALLGQILFFDNNLSFHGNQSCSSCHSPDTAFVDLRENSADKMVSQGHLVYRHFRYFFQFHSFISHLLNSVISSSVFILMKKFKIM